MKRVLVTGGTGFIGSCLVEELLGHGCELSVISRRKDPGLSLQGQCVDFLTADIIDISSLRKLPRGYDYVFHLAAVRDSLDEKKCHQTNVEGTKNLLQWLSESGPRPKKLIHVSSLGACGLSNDGTAKKESDTMNPCSIYGKAKMLAEKAVEEYGDKLPYIIVRPCKVYGPGDMKILFHFRLAKYGIMPALGVKPRLLSLCFVRDLVRYMISLAESGKVNEVYFVSDGRVYSWQEFYQAIGAVLGRKLRKIVIPESMLLPCLPALKKISGIFPGWMRLEPTTFEEIRWRGWLCDPSKLYSDFPSFSPTDMLTGLTKTAEWFRREGLI